MARPARPEGPVSLEHVLLDALAGGETVSGEALARRLGVSRGQDGAIQRVRCWLVAAHESARGPHPLDAAQALRDGCPGQAEALVLRHSGHWLDIGAASHVVVPEGTEGRNLALWGYCWVNRASDCWSSRPGDCWGSRRGDYHDVQVATVEGAALDVQNKRAYF